jgi:hypothetical protein
MPSWITPWGWALIGLGAVSTVVWAWQDPRSALGHTLLWVMLGFNAGLALLLGLRVLVQLPLIEASELGIAIWLNGPYRRPFFAPWSRVRAIVLTQARGPGVGGAVRDALGIELIQDSQLCLPADLPRAETAAGAEPVDLVWSRARIRGNPVRWVELLSRMKAAGTDPARDRA